MPAAGVEPAQNISVIMYFAVRANFRAKPIKKERSISPAPYEKSVHAVTFSSELCSCQPIQHDLPVSFIKESVLF